MFILFLDFFGSDPSKMDQTRKFGEQTSQILEDFQLFIKHMFGAEGKQGKLEMPLLS